MKCFGLFSGIGGMELGLQRAGFEIAGMCEIDPYCRAVLRKHWPEVPIYEDVRELTADAIGPVQLISGGFPCQPWSLAGKRGGTADDRDLWPEMRRVVAAAQPRWVLGENVPGLDDERFMGLDRVLSDLDELGYQAVPYEIPACAVDAKHRRSRLWIVAHSIIATSGRNRLREHSGRGEAQPTPLSHEERQTHSSNIEQICETLADATRDIRRTPRYDGPKPLNRHGADVPNANNGDAQGLVSRLHGAEQRQEQTQRSAGLCNGAREPQARAAECRLGGVADGFPRWLDEPDEISRVTKGQEGRGHRLKALGNAVVPQIPEFIGHAIFQAEQEVTE